jgi:hypothetical protein
MMKMFVLLVGSENCGRAMEMNGNLGGIQSDYIDFRRGTGQRRTVTSNATYAREFNA